MARAGSPRTWRPISSGYRDDQIHGIWAHLVTGREAYYTRDFGARTKWLLDLDGRAVTFAADYNRHTADYFDQEVAAAGYNSPTATPTAGPYNVRSDMQYRMTLAVWRFGVKVEVPFRMPTL